jgi:hypothetical protein
MSEHFEQLDEHLCPLAFAIGKTYRSESSVSGTNKPSVCVCSWELAMNGEGIRWLITIDNTIHGETVIYWDPQRKTIAFRYTYNNGLTGQGTARIVGNQFIAYESRTGDPNGITELEGIREFMPDGSYRLTGRYKANGRWIITINEIYYVIRKN